MSIWYINRILLKLARLPQAGRVAAASRCPARADDPKVGRDGPASLGAPWRAPWRAAAARCPLGRLGYLCAGGAKAMFGAAADHSMLPGPR